jgi:hypothetical protein
MNAIEQAIKEAVEKGGYEITFDHEHEYKHGSYGRFLLDPSFWQALGKAKGWNIGTVEINWHRLIDHLAEGKDAESFFAAL